MKYKYAFSVILLLNVICGWICIDNLFPKVRSAFVIAYSASGAALGILLLLGG